ncbi:GspH/FimT family pseudopilin [Stenotrophomonas sp. SI-NJAU-1]|uniref:GspH/FimT family pseudopilin n=1 Tax=Stenotrophomonas sp. SI-NJAU-1 TaxID=2886359 RepID=UPI001E526379|nr:GspH/FimT family pseudopilin [Stenotrophomonas sp. SI-NJAU-1]UEX19589.1 GspH/FimT family pseudopilin [Stenotrophomonas sp. SI-NJAU-1]
MVAIKACSHAVAMPAATLLPHPARLSRGLHLLELVIVLMVLSVLLALAWGPWQRTIRHLQAESLRAELATSLALARSTATTQRRRVTVCGSDDAVNCGNAWNQGWLVRMEPPPWAAATDAAVIHVREPLPAAVRMQSSQHRLHVQFLPDGRNAGTNQSLLLCVDGKEHSRVIISVGGRVRSERPRSEKPC